MPPIAELSRPMLRLAGSRIDPQASGPHRRPDVVGITAYTVHVKTVKRMFETIKRRDPRVLTVVGGHHATVRPEDFLDGAIDVVVAGEGVAPLRELVARFERDEDLAGIPGVGLPRDGELLFAKPPPLVRLDELPLPNRELTADHRHWYYSEWMKPLASIRTSKGCPYRCRFCALWKIAGVAGLSAALAI